MNGVRSCKPCSAMDVDDGHADASAKGSGLTLAGGCDILRDKSLLHGTRFRHRPTRSYTNSRSAPDVMRFTQHEIFSFARCRPVDFAKRAVVWPGDLQDSGVYRRLFSRRRIHALAIGKAVLEPHHDVGADAARSAIAAGIRV